MTVDLTTREAQFMYDVLIRRRMYKPADIPGGAKVWEPFMEDLVLKLKPLIKYDRSNPTETD